MNGTVLMVGNPMLNRTATLSKKWTSKMMKKRTCKSSSPKLLLCSTLQCSIASRISLLLEVQAATKCASSITNRATSCALSATCREASFVWILHTIPTASPSGQLIHVSALWTFSLDYFVYLSLNHKATTQ